MSYQEPFHKTPHDPSDPTVTATSLTIQPKIVLDFSSITERFSAAAFHAASAGRPAVSMICGRARF